MDSLSGCNRGISLPPGFLSRLYAGISPDDTDESSTPGHGADPALRSAASAQGRCRILIVDDSRADVFMIREAIAQSHIASELHFAADGDKAVDFILATDSNESDPVPDLILLDLNLPRKSGFEVLKQIRLSRRCAGTPVLIVSSADSEKDRSDAARFGASGYFRKPSSYAGFMKLGAAVRELLGRDAPGTMQ